jgi:hypothetical protein
MQVSTHRSYIFFAALAVFPLVVSAEGGLGDLFAVMLKKASTNLAAGSLSDPKKVESVLRGVAAEVNPTMPVAIDKDTRLDKIVPGPGAKFTYNYTITTRKFKEINHTYFLNFLSKNLRVEACSNADLKIFFENKVTVGYTYKSSDNIHIATLDVTPRDCGYPA